LEKNKTKQNKKKQANKQTNNNNNNNKTECLSLWLHFSEPPPQHTPKPTNPQQGSSLWLQSYVTLQSSPKQTTSSRTLRSLQLTVQPTTSFQPTSQPSMEESNTEILQQASSFPLLPSSSIEPSVIKTNDPSPTLQTIQSPQSTQKLPKVTSQSAKHQQVPSLPLQHSPTLPPQNAVPQSVQPTAQPSLSFQPSLSVEDWTHLQSVHSLAPDSPSVSASQGFASSSAPGKAHTYKH